MPDLPLEFRRYLLEFQRYKYFTVSAAISGRRSLLESPRNTLFVLAVVEKLSLAVGILMISVILSEI